MSCFRKSRTANLASSYATIDDFFLVFTEHMDGLYRLALLLTGDQQKAERCFVAGIEDSVQSNHVFKAWARSWAKRTIIQNAIHELKPRPQRTKSFPDIASSYSAELTRDGNQHFDLAAVLALGDFERFVFVLSVLEHYSEHDCAVLLSRSRQEIRSARSWALMRLVNSRPMVFPTAIKVESVQELSR